MTVFKEAKRPSLTNLTKTAASQIEETNNKTLASVLYFFLVNRYDVTYDYDSVSDGF